MSTNEILVNHAHVFPEAANAKGTVENLLRLMDGCGIAEAVCFAPFAYQVKGIEPNGWLKGELRKGGGRLHGFGTIDVEAGDIGGQVRRVAELGFRGIKFHHAGQEVPVLSVQAREVYAEAERLGLFLVFHVGVHRSRMKDSRVMDLDEVAWDYPKLRFSLEHIGGYHFFKEALAVIFNHKPTPWAQGPCHLYGGLSSVFSTEKNLFWHLTQEQLLEAVAQIGAEQLIFGLDFPYNGLEETLLGIRRIRQLGLGAEGEGRILGGNMREILSGVR